MSATYKVLGAENQHGEPVDVLVAADQFEGDPADYFVSSTHSDAKVLGEVEIDDPLMILSSAVFRSDS